MSTPGSVPAITLPPQTMDAGDIAAVRILADAWEDCLAYYDDTRMFTSGCKTGRRRLENAIRHVRNGGKTRHYKQREYRSNRAENFGYNIWDL